MVSSLDKRWNTIYPSLVRLAQRLRQLGVTNIADETSYRPNMG
jgi:hypothetical protein